MKVIATKVHGPTDIRGSRISADDGDGNRIMSTLNTADRNETSHGNAARALCDKMGWTGELIGGYAKRGMVWVFEDSNIRA